MGGRGIFWYPKTPHIITKRGGVDREREGYILGGSQIEFKVVYCGRDG